MKVGERGQVTIPKEIRDRFGITANTEVEFQIDDGRIVLRKKSNPDAMAKWIGYCKGSLERLGFASDDEFIDVARGRDRLRDYQM
jgi:AbrB family looped-hinge helix DNA binding protein